ncbi:hypothetical protein [Lactobacillus isalae]|uniref:hypothetical protein n=1 Tax=Lactobacillus isalae TaxID=2993455 RepID=UPI0024A8241B|nr:hypothetical protein [Lactobacillus isalae]
MSKKQFEKMHRKYMDDINYKGSIYHTIYSDDTCIDDGLPFAYAYKKGNNSIYKVYFKPVDGWQDMDDASNWVDDWEADIHHIDQATSDVSEFMDLLQQLN